MAFLADPHVGDYILFESHRQLTTKVLYLCHYSPEPGYIIITEPIVCESYDDMLINLDWFKSTFSIVDIKSDDGPQSYYIFYRSVLQLLNRSSEVDPCVDTDPVSIKIFAEACRAVLVAQLGPDVDFNQIITDLHMLIIARKTNETCGVKILPIIKVWEQKINESGSIKWTVSLAQCRQAAKLIFSKLKSISSDRHPNFEDS